MPKVLKVTETPNPQALKFHMDCRVIGKGSLSFARPQDAQGNETARALFEIEGVESVFYIQDVVTINKNPKKSWDDLIPPVADVLEETLVSTLEGLSSSDLKGPQGLSNNAFGSLNKEEQIAQINSIMDKSIRPGLAGDGGGLEVLNFENNVLTVHYQGACGSCPSATGGTLQFIENTLKRDLDPAIRVMAQ